MDLLLGFWLGVTAESLACYLLLKRKGVSLKQVWEYFTK